MNIRTVILALAALSALTTSLTVAAPPPDEPTLPATDERPGPTRAEAIEAYVKDCSATFQTTAFIYGEPEEQNECKARDIEQNCNPDVFGCLSETERCEAGCGPLCDTCQNRCAASCNGCKKKCPSGDAACVRRCAETRAGCRDGCLGTLDQCRTTKCGTASKHCWDDNEKRARRECDHTQCLAYNACINEPGEDDELAFDRNMDRCQKKFAKIGDFCQWLCGPMDFTGYTAPSSYTQSGLVSDLEAAARCTPQAQCPSDYARVAPYLGKFCATGGLTDEDLATLRADVKGGKLAARTLSLVFNVYGAMYGYEFKKEKWMNAFFYAPGKWLPGECQVMIKAYKSAAQLPHGLSDARDRVKGLWTEVK